MITLAGRASTNSRAWSRPLPKGAVLGKTCSVYGARELVEFTFEDGHTEDRELLSWVGGQAGLLWGGGPYPSDIDLELESVRSAVHGSYGHAAEYALADALGEVFAGYLTGMDSSVRFFSNGGDACAAAVRIAREATGFSPIATQGYHGAQTDFAHQPDWAGYPADNVHLHQRFEFGEVGGMNLAAVASSCIMVEVPAWDDEKAITAFLIECRRTADVLHIPLIFDDVVCGFRLALAGTAERYGVLPDMICLGKAMSATGGISALIGRADLVGKLGNGSVFYSTTFGGAPDRCAVADATVRWLMAHKAEVYGQDGHLRRVGLALKHGLKERGVPVVGQPERSGLNFPTDAEWLGFCSSVIEQGVMLHRPQFPSMAHTMKDVDETLAAVERAIEGMRDDG
jgi:glutamate-1-semialdehyde aminotransferase